MSGIASLWSHGVFSKSQTGYHKLIKMGVLFTFLLTTPGQTVSVVMNQIWLIGLLFPLKWQQNHY